jgi:hypothetical protein
MAARMSPGRFQHFLINGRWHAEKDGFRGGLGKFPPRAYRITRRELPDEIPTGCGFTLIGEFLRLDYDEES